MLEIELDNEENPMNILNAIKQTINQNSLLRSYIIKEENANYFIEFDCLNNLNICII